MSVFRQTAQIKALGQPQDDEQVLWEGKPDLATLARTAFHTRIVTVYFLGLIAIALALGSFGGAAITAGAGLVTLGLIYGFAWLGTRTTTYILTDRRLILNIGMAIEKSVNIPLKMIGAAHLTDRGAGSGDIAVELLKGNGLGYAILWPHARPFHLSKPQPMLRAIRGVRDVAAKLAAATALHEAIALGGGEAASAEAERGDGMTGALA
ncbi:photosynthetic complex putative assembly protein PuhB [Qipengyuania sp. G39]|uniref:Photosynthetic complex putative assembly protein PuhB n=1 Tax=Qipengyuania profundimaris TaxID=3067652 RepID=A0ABT9HPA2_9SPHN|nr:photosynthetic complex putative assembly protein PuhB [Qipengyuania sp. G39]MDP4574974.1 photosynthetic complex putative assembly protein PuhB [Qipengyuania sp. G39]